jgi:hypothetical protein
VKILGLSIVAAVVAYGCALMGFKVGLIMGGR